MTVRLTTAADEATFLRLLRRVYGETYSYQELYAPGGFGRMLGSGKVLSFGNFDDDGEMFSHSAFLLKDPLGDYVESGMSFRVPSSRTADKDDEARIWRWLLDQVPPGVGWIHQNTTTAHPLAQRYAWRRMGARPTGFIADYALGERVAGHGEAGAMQALTMATGLGSGPVRTALLPESDWTEWITDRLAAFGRPVEVIAPGPLEGAVATIEENAALGLRRQAVDRREGQKEWAAEARVELLHLPLDRRSRSLPEWLDRGWLPVGVRLHVRRPDELVLQHLPRSRRGAVVAALGAARWAHPDSEAMVARWSELCPRPS